MPEIQAVARYAVIGVFGVSLVVALASGLVRTPRGSPVGAPGRALRAASGPLIPAVERRLVRARRLARDLGAEAGATGDRGAVTYCLRERDETAQDTRQPRGRDRRQCPGEQAVRCLGNDPRFRRGRARRLVGSAAGVRLRTSSVLRHLS